MIHPNTDAFFREWVKITENKLLREIDKLDVKDSGKLKEGLHSKIHYEGMKIVGEIYFKIYGRFVDMGAMGRQSIEINRNFFAKKWYSPTFFGRLSILRGVLGLQASEQVMKTIIEEIKL